MVIAKKIFVRKDLKEKPNQEKVWDDISDTWKDYRTKQIPIVSEFLQDKKGKIIDLGCGTGRNMIPDKNIEYYGVDFSGKMIKNAEKFVKINKINAKLFKSKADDLSLFDNEMFDYGLFMATLHCIEDKKERLNALEEFYRVLKPGAKALISVWDGEDNRFNGKKEVYIPWAEGGENHMRFYYIYSEKEIMDLLESVGFKITEEYKPREHDRFSRKNWIFKIEK